MSLDIIHIPNTEEVSENLDYLGILASGLCLIHCLLLPIILPYLSLTHSDEGTSTFHYILFPILLLMAGLALSNGLKKHHKSLPSIIGGMGILLLSSTILPTSLIEFSEQVSHMLNISGSSLLILAHILNLTFSMKSSANVCKKKSCSCSKSHTLI